MKQSIELIDSYNEHLKLVSGEAILLRQIRPSDKESLKAAFAELSGPSRHRRFFAAKQMLSEDELRYFTEIDGFDHFALAAIELNEDRTEGKGLGIARYIRLANDPGCAEVAITVIDRMQGKGIGRILLERLILAAIERGVARFRFECLTHNLEMQRLVKKVCRVVETHQDGEIMIAEAELPTGGISHCQRTRQAFFDLLDLLRGLAIESVDLQMDLGRTTLNRTMDAALSGVRMLHKSAAPDTADDQTSKVN
jgi:GNAT superfamily N-acetyltransferase